MPFLYKVRQFATEDIFHTLILPYVCNLSLFMLIYSSMSAPADFERLTNFTPSPHEKADVARFLGCLMEGHTATFVVPHIQVQRQQEMREHLYRQYANTLH